MADNSIPNIFTEEPKPKNRLRVCFTVLFIAAWLTVLGTGVYNVSVLRRSSATPTGSRTEPLTEHGSKVYVTEADSDEIHLLNTIARISDGVVIVTGFALAYFYIFPAPAEAHTQRLAIRPVTQLTCCDNSVKTLA